MLQESDLRTSGTSASSPEITEAEKKRINITVPSLLSDYRGAGGHGGRHGEDRAVSSRGTLVRPRNHHAGPGADEKRQKGEAMKTYSVTVYEYDDLSDTAKARARDWFREISVSDTDFADSVIEDAKHIAEILGIYFKDRAINTVGGKTRYEPAIYWSGFSSQGDGASFEGQYSWSVDMPHRIRQYAPQDETLHQIADDLAEIQEKHGNQLTATITQSGHYTHEHTMQAEVQRLDEDDQSLEVDPRFSDALLEVFRRFARWIYRQLEQEYEYQTSDEQVAETIRINEYEFYADGRRACLPQEIQK